MKKLATAIAAIALVGTPAFAADMAVKMPVKAPPPAPVPVYNWTGFYAGLNAGAVCSRASANPGAFIAIAGGVDFPDRQAAGMFPSFLGSDCGFIGGGQIGYNFQSLNWVWGLETDFQGTSLHRSDNRSFPATAAFGGFDANTEQASQKTAFLGTVRGRVGFLTTQTLLIYGTGGLAYGQVSNNVSTTGVPNGFPGVTVSTGDTNTKVGWTAGGGGEWLFAPKWSVKVEALNYRLNSDTVSLNYAVLPGVAPAAINYTFKNDGVIARAGLNYQFH
jgi:outer membrane immunogenic protein